MRFFFRKKKVATLPKEEPKFEKDPNRCGFLDLPGEIRNMIYGYAIYPNLDQLLIIHGKKPPEFGRTVLHPGLFRVSHQVRKEALSYLISTKKITISNLRTACAFFQCVGPAIADMKHLAVIQQPFASEPPKWNFENLYSSSAETDFFEYLEHAKSLVTFRFELLLYYGRYKAQNQRPQADEEFLERLGHLMHRKPNVRFHWTFSMGALHRRHGIEANCSSARKIRRLLGPEAEITC